MRELVDLPRLEAFLDAAGSAARAPGRMYLVGGASAVLRNWRPSTIDVDMKLEPEQDSVLRAIPRLKEELRINVELASPGDFLPEVPGWRDRSPFIRKAGNLSIHHYDFYAQCLAKIERGHARDVEDIRQMITSNLIDLAKLMEFFELMVPHLYRFPAVDEASFRRAMEEVEALYGSGK